MVIGCNNLGGGVQEASDSVIGSVVKHDFIEERGLAVPAAAGVLGVGVVVEGVVGGLAEVATPQDEESQAEVERFEEAVPVFAPQEFSPCWLWCGHLRERERE